MVGLKGWDVPGSVHRAHADTATTAVKGMADVAAAAVVLLVLLPLMLVIALLVSLDGGPVFSAQTCIGPGGRVFRRLNFRSTSVHRVPVLPEPRENDPPRAGRWSAAEGIAPAPRLTAIGHILRKTGLDELPCLLNLVRSEMSLTY